MGLVETLGKTLEVLTAFHVTDRTISAIKCEVWDIEVAGAACQDRD